MDLHGSFVDTKYICILDILSSVVYLIRRFYPLAAGDHSAVKLKAAYAKTIEALKGVRIRVLYLHA